MVYVRYIVGWTLIKKRVRKCACVRVRAPRVCTTESILVPFETQSVSASKRELFLIGDLSRKSVESVAEPR